VAESFADSAQKKIKSKKRIVPKKIKSKKRIVPKKNAHV
jgi:hypothetical protein